MLQIHHHETDHRKQLLAWGFPFDPSIRMRLMLDFIIIEAPMNKSLIIFGIVNIPRTVSPMEAGIWRQTQPLRSA